MHVSVEFFEIKMRALGLIASSFRPFGSLCDTVSITLGLCTLAAPTCPTELQHAIYLPLILNS